MRVLLLQEALDKSPGSLIEDGISNDKWNEKGALEETEA
jgi:hypothetical protein